ncbi:MAG: hypothetical protein ACK5P0_00585, partial [bacterium]
IQTWLQKYFQKPAVRIVVAKMDEQQLTPEQVQAILLFQIEQKLRSVIANQVEQKFHGMYHGASHDIAHFIRTGS